MLHEHYPVETWAQLVFSGIHTSVYLLNTLILPLKMQEQKEHAAFLQGMFLRCSELIFPCGFCSPSVSSIRPVSTTHFTTHHYVCTFSGAMLTECSNAYLYYHILTNLLPVEQGS
jgi:hypothetical protein